MKTAFEDMIVWQEAEMLTLKVYQEFQQNKDRWFKDQICRASVSIMNNIAEWYERTWSKDKIRFYTIAKWSNAEVRSMLHIAYKLNYLQEVDYMILKQHTYGIAKMLYTLIQKVAKA